MSPKAAALDAVSKLLAVLSKKPLDEELLKKLLETLENK